MILYISTSLCQLQVAHPSVKFVFSETGYSGMLDDYAAEKCSVLAAGASDITSDTKFTRLFCDKNLVITDSLIIEIVSSCLCPINPLADQSSLTSIFDSLLPFQ